MENKSQIWVKEILRAAGITINGQNPWDIKITNPELYNRVKSQGSLGLGESYMDGWWECENLDEFFYRLLSSDVTKKVGLSLPIVLMFLRTKLMNLQGKRRAFQIGKKHYDIGNDLFKPMLGKTMAYSCGYWVVSKSLDKAQEAKFDLICRKLDLKKGQFILDIGCGWGGFAKFAAENYGVRVVGVTVSSEQAKFAKELCKDLPVEIKVIDYRDLQKSQEKFDHIISIGMFEHVGHKNYRTFMQIAKNCLKPEGLFLLHTIGSLKTNHTTDPWVDKYIFPNGILPSLSQISNSAEGLFVIEDIHNFGQDYDKTLVAWDKNFKKSWPKIKDKYGEKFYRMWTYYLLSYAGSFRARTNQLWQIVLSPNGVKGGYKPAR